LPLPAVHGYGLQEGGGSAPLAPTLARIQMPIRILILFDADPDSTYQLDADPDVNPDSDFLSDADPEIYLMWMRIQVSQIMQILADPDPQHRSKRITCMDKEQLVWIKKTCLSQPSMAMASRRAAVPPPSLPRWKYSACVFLTSASPPCKMNCGTRHENKKLP
jgi:hypothetical protein